MLFLFSFISCCSPFPLYHQRTFALHLNFLFFVGAFFFVFNYFKRGDLEGLKKHNIPPSPKIFTQIFCLLCSPEALFKPWIVKCLLYLKLSKWKCNFIIYYQKTVPGHPVQNTEQEKVMDILLGNFISYEVFCCSFKSIFTLTLYLTQVKFFFRRDCLSKNRISKLISSP